MRRVAQVSGAHVTGVNIDRYQVDKARRYIRKARLEGRCDVIEADFLDIPVAAGSFDAAYALEAACHAPNKRSVYSEVARVLKPGGMFLAMEWCITPLFDHDDPAHRRLKLGIERGNAIANLDTFETVSAALEKSGFEVLEERDCAPDSDPGLEWYAPLTGVELSIRSLPRLPWGRVVVHTVTGLLELARIAPKGTRDVSAFLNASADALVAAGKLGIFTPMYLLLARKR
jgi:sterol 24-C-methyltransferase